MYKQFIYITLLVQSIFWLPNLCNGQNPGDDYVPILIDGKWGYCDRAKNMVIPPQYDGADLFRNGLAFVTVNEKDGLINSKGEFVLEPKYLNLDKYKGDPCAVPYTTDAYSHGLKFVSDFKNLGYTIVKILKVDTSISYLQSIHEYKIFKPDGSPMLAGEIMDIKYDYRKGNDDLRYKLLFKSDSVCYYWNELDSIYSIGVYDEINWTGHSKYLHTAKDSSKYIVDKSGRIIFQSTHSSISIKNDSDKVILRVSNKDKIEKYAIKNMQLVLIATYAPDYYRYASSYGYGYDLERSNGVYNLYSKSGDMVKNSDSDEYIIHNKKHMILTKNETKSISRISDGKRLNKLSYCHVQFTHHDLVIASYNSCEEGIYTDGHLIVRGKPYNMGVFKLDGEMIIDTIYDEIRYCDDGPSFKCSKDTLKFYYDITGNIILKENLMNLKDSASNIYQLKDINGYNCFNKKTKEIPNAKYSTDSKKLDKGLNVITRNILKGKSIKHKIRHVANSNGDTIIPQGYQSIDTFNVKAKQLKVRYNGKYGIINYKNQWIKPPIYNYIRRLNDNIILSDNNSVWLTDLNFIRLSKIYTRISELGQDHFLFEEQNKYGVLDRDGNVILDSKYYGIQKIKKDLVLVRSDPDYRGVYGWVSLEGVEYFDLP